MAKMRFQNCAKCYWCKINYSYGEKCTNANYFHQRDSITQGSTGGCVDIFADLRRM